MVAWRGLGSVHEVLGQLVAEQGSSCCAHRRHIGLHAVRRGVVLGCALDFPRPLGGLRSLGEGWWRSLGSVSAGEALGT